MIKMKEVIYRRFRCMHCKIEIYILTEDECTKCYCRKCSLPMQEVTIGN